ncbi:hypothetical protein FJQ98_02610 [Lysinibacillus agricola]|uniref:Uncharacterized protein n=1 Tax=Lysinibacillus agricola TaxID=2590012 RepID=A0ABX7ATA7_9BACI|nr:MULTISPECIES: hypothetical protein [Lysinibacillus]KOS59759.1 hypothetical protein AN161_27030 [Lysinibacillus sp. FJAT-14222]QQP12985.1 hypothetical protein FJQ98_02610 [Lysinibacillus agricola]
MTIEPKKALTIEDVQRQRREAFAKRYEEKFGKSIQASTNKQDTPQRGFALNYYGIESNWL